MKRNPFLFVVLCLLVIGGLFFRYLSPSQSRILANVADKIETTASNVVAAVASVTIAQTSDSAAVIQVQPKEEERVIAAAVIPDANSNPFESQPSANVNVVVAQADSSLAKGEKAAIANIAIDTSAEAQQRRANQAAERAAALLDQAVKAAEVAREELKMAQIKMAEEMRARPNLSLLGSTNAAQKQVAPKVEVKTKEIAPGSPLAELEQALAKHTVRFDWTKSTLGDDAQVQLAKVARLLEKNPELSIRVIGHTDSNGTDELNKWLGLIRARRVRQQLIAQGINPKRLHASSRGAKEPIETNDTAMGRWKNRRVEFAISEK